MINKKDFEAIANILNKQYALNYFDTDTFDILDNIKIDLATHFKKVNPKFNEGKFYKACLTNQNYKKR